MLGGVLIVVGLFFLPWYGVGEGKIAPIQIRHTPAPSLSVQVGPPDLSDRPAVDDFGAWTGQGLLGTIGNAVLLLAALAATAFVGLRALGRRPPRQVGMLVAALGFVAIVVVVLRIVLRPEEVHGYEFEATLKMGVLVTLLGAILVTAGGVVGVRRDRELHCLPRAMTLSTRRRSTR